MEPIRVLQVVGRMDRGGIETLIMNLYRNIDRSKVQFDFLCHYGREAYFNDEIRELGGKIYEMPKIKSTKKTYYYKFFEYWSALNFFFKTHKEYKIVHGHMTNTATIYMTIAKRYGVKTCIAHSHLTESRQGLTGYITSFLQIPLQKVSTDYFGCSKMAGKWLFNEKIIKSEKFKVLNNAVDTLKFEYNEEVRKKYRKELCIENDFVIGHVGRFFHQKNHEFLIDIFEQIVKKKKNSKLLLIGKGVLREKIEKKVKRKKLESNVIFLGERSDIPELLQAIDLFIMPSHFEGLPVVGIEAQAAGVNCIFSDSITREIDVINNNCFISLRENSEKWAEEALKYYGNERQSTKKILQDRGYDIQTVAKWMENYYLNKHYK